MKFANIDTLDSAIMKSFLSWYEARCTDGAWPPVTAFRAETIPPHILPHIGRVDVELNPFRIYYRAVGSAISDSLDVEMSGRYLDEIGLEQETDLLEWYRITLTSPGPVIVRGEQTIEGESFVYEGCCVPLGTADDDPRAFIICTDFLNTEAWRSALHRRRYDRPT